MMQVIEIILALIFLIYAFRTILFEVYLWQLKEYRFDRMISHISTVQGKKLLVNPNSIFKWILLIISPLLYLFLGKGVLIWIVLAVYVLELMRTFHLLLKGSLRIPQSTIKAAFISIISFVIIVVCLTTLPEKALFFLVLDRTLSLIVFAGVTIINVPSYCLKKFIIHLARKKIDSCKNVLVIGITGSYGKTSTKDFLATILSTKFKVLKTAGYNNTEIGVAQTILRKLSFVCDIFVVEMGAYKKGEIAAICNIVKPKIGVITGINQQHIQLFGTIEKTMEAKFELIQQLSKKGVAVFNGGNSHVQEMVGWTRQRRPDLSVWQYFNFYDEKIFYAEKLKRERKNIFASDIKVQTDKLLFKILYDKQTITCQANLVGAQNVENLLAASCVALELGMSLSQIKQAISKIEAPSKTMRPISGEKGKFIDDTFNTNPDGVIAALKYLKLFPKKKILVLTPLIELGSEADKIHELLGKKAAAVCDLIFLTNPNYNKQFIAGASQITGGREKVKLGSAIELVSMIRLNLDGAVIVFEGKEAGKILKQITDKI